MVLLAAAICNKAGKVIVSRQFVEMTRARIEGLLAAFPKLMTSGVQHTFVETESVRYVYQPLEKLFMLLITTKASNILEDLETLRLFARLIPEYCRNMEESEISDQSFPLIFAFDEIVALGYRENVNLAQIRTFTEMDSHEEKVFMAVRQTQEKEAKENMKRKARELQQARRDAAKRGGGGKLSGLGGGGYGGSYKGGMDSPIIDMTHAEPVKTTSSIPSSKISAGSGRALKLGSKTKDVDVFVDQLKSEGERVSSTSAAQSIAAKISATPQADQESVHTRVEEKLSLTVGRDGGIQNLELHGMITLRVSEEKCARIRILVNNNDDKGVQLQTHPNVDKKMFLSSSLIGLKNSDKPFPVGQDVGVLKWRLQSTHENHVPLSINCWPSETGTGCDVNIEYELKKADMELNDIRITIPTPSGVGAPVVNECDGQYHYDNRRNILEWSLPVIDSSNDSGSMEFSVAGHPDDFFPISVSFVSKTSYCDIQIVEIQNVDDSLPPVKYSSEVVFFTEKYEIV